MAHYWRGGVSPPSCVPFRRRWPCCASVLEVIDGVQGERGDEHRVSEEGARGRGDAAPPHCALLEGRRLAAGRDGESFTPNQFQPCPSSYRNGDSIALRCTNAASRFDSVGVTPSSGQSIASVGSSKRMPRSWLGV